MSIASTLKCWQSIEGKMNGRFGANSASRILSILSSDFEDGKEPEIKLEECRKKEWDPKEADTCIKIDMTFNSTKFAGKSCGNIYEMNIGLSLIDPDFQISQDKCLKVSDEINEKIKKIWPITANASYHVNYLCGCSTDGCNGGIRNEGTLLPLTIVGFFIMKKIIGQTF